MPSNKYSESIAMLLSSLTGFPFVFGQRPARANRRKLRHTPRAVESLEGRELLSTLGIHAQCHTDPPAVHQRVLRPPVSYYNANNTTDSATLPVSGWQGIRQADSPGQYMITGTSGPNGLLYIGAINGHGTSYAVNVPNSTSTSIYGSNNLGNGQFQLVGSYRTATSSVVEGFFFQGSVVNGAVTGTYTTLSYPGATFNYIHSTAGGLAVGNSDGPTATGQPLGSGTASIFDTTTGAPITNIKVPGAFSTTAYGIWYNGGTSYTIIGGFSRRAVTWTANDQLPLSQGYMVDYNSATQKFSQFTTVNPPNGGTFATHIQGISGTAPGVYQLGVDTVQGGSTTAGQGWWVTVKRNRDGSFGPGAWVKLNYPNVSGLTSNDSVAGNTAVGIILGSSESFCYQAMINIGPTLAASGARPLHSARVGGGR
jgi:hypothetical protein